MPLDATAGGMTANSYLTRAEAAAYFARRLRTSAWVGASDPEKDLALMTATARLDQEDFLGVKATREQALKWPRYDTCDRDGYWYDSDSVPRPVQDAACELALYLLETDGLRQSGLSNFAHIKLGPLDITPKQPQSSGALPAQVVRLLDHLLTSAPGMIRMLRG